MLAYIKRLKVLEQRVNALEKKIADLEMKVQSQPKRNFIPEDSNGICTSNDRCKGIVVN